jgi:hypothetical protein
MAKAAAPWPLYARLLPALPTLLFYLAVTSRFQNATQAKWPANNTAINVPASTAGSDVSSSMLERSDARAASTAAAVSSSPASADTATKAALAAAAKQPVVIGLQRSGQWPFWQAIHAPDRIGDLGTRAATNMEGPIMDAQHPDWVSAQQHQLSCSCLAMYLARHCLILVPPLFIVHAGYAMAAGITK